MDGLVLDPPRRDFPLGLRVLAVDYDANSLMNLSSTLGFLKYQVTTRGTGKDVLSLLRQKRDEFDILLTEVLLTDMDGFDLLGAVRAEFNKSLQVVLFSRYQGCDAAIRALKQGACAFYPKPIPLEVLENLWQLVYKIKIQSCSSNVVVVEQQQQQSMPLPLETTTVNGMMMKQKRKRDDSITTTNVIIRGGGKGSKKRRVCWLPELHDKFLAAIESIGADNLTPQKILAFMKNMGVEDLTAPQVASHLQQYRKTLMKSSVEEQSTGNTCCYSDLSFGCGGDFSDKFLRTTSAAVGSYSSQPSETTTSDHTTFFQHGEEEESMPPSYELGADFDWITFFGLEKEEVIISPIASN